MEIKEIMSKALNVEKRIVNEDSKQVSFDMPISSSTEFTDLAKLYSVDAILENIKSVFGPYAGVYGEVLRNDKFDKTKLSKSKDGHNFLAGLSFESAFIETTLSMIRERTLFVSSSDTNTSRDGTTSLAVISSLLSRYLLLNKINEPLTFKIPAKINKMVFQILNANFRALADKDKVLIYEEDKCDYLNGEEGFKQALNTIKTTVDGDPMITGAFEKLMKICKEEKINILDSALSAPERRADGTSGLEIKLKSGAKFHASYLDEKSPFTLVNDNAPVFLLDGFISDECVPVVERALQKIMDTLLYTKDENGIYLFSRYNRNGMKPPVFLANRSSSAMKDMFCRLSEPRIVKLNINGEIVTEKIEPRVLLVFSEDVNIEPYEYLKRIFSNSIIDLSGYSRYIRSSALSKFKVDNIRDNKCKVGEININKDLRISDDCKTLHKLDFTFLKDIDDEKHNSISTITESTINIGDAVTTISYDGFAVYITARSEAQKVLMRDMKMEVITALEDLTRNSEAFERYTNIKKIFSSATLTPVFTFKTEDEFTNMFDLFQDAVGIFKSVHVHGVLCGANTYMFKIYEPLREKVLHKVNQILVEDGIGEMLRNRVNRYATILMDSLLMAYTEAYKLLLREDDEFVLHIIDELKDKPANETYDINTGNWTDEILESTRSTVDILNSALDITYDLSTMDRIRLTQCADITEMRSEFDVTRSKYKMHNVNKKYLDK